MICSKFALKLTNLRFHISCHYLEFVIISDRKVISSPLLLSLSVLGAIFKHFLTSNNFAYIQIGQFLSRCLDFTFKSTRKLDRDNLDLLDKPKTAGHCDFPLTNLHSGESVYYVPESNISNQLNSLYICSGNTQLSRPFSREA